MNGLMLGMMYALVAVGFTLFLGVLDVIKFSHGDVLTVGAFTGLATYLGLSWIGVVSPTVQVIVILLTATLCMGLLGALIARYLVLPLKSAPPLNTLLITLMLGTVLREAIRLFYPQGANPKPFPSLLPGQSYTTELVFDVPAGRPHFRLLLTADVPVNWFLIGHEGSFFHRKVFFALEPAQELLLD